MRREVMFYTKGPEEQVNCQVCPRLCNIPPGKRGFCRVRENMGGILYATNYAECSSYALDPIEKKPLYHFYPGKLIFSLGTVGCNLRCGFCQNWQIAQETPSTTRISPEQAVELALEQKSAVTPVWAWPIPTRSLSCGMNMCTTPPSLPGMPA